MSRATTGRKVDYIAGDNLTVRLYPVNVRGLNHELRNTLDPRTGKPITLSAVVNDALFKRYAKKS